MLGRNGDMDSNGGLAGPALLAKEGDRAHRRSF
jgi:hypothetical protein